MSEPIGTKFERLVAIMARLRAPGGCPWDREQTFDTIKPYTLEETYEVLDAIDRARLARARRRTGRLHAAGRLLRPDGRRSRTCFRIEDALDAINEKLVRRHPHVFGDGDAETADDVKQHLGRDQGRREEGRRAKRRKALLDGVPRALPALVEAQQISVEAAGVGFDWENAEPGPRQAPRGARRIRRGARNGAQDELEDELGDLLFVLVNLARFVKVDPEQALRKTNAKFRERFGYVEARLAERGKHARPSPTSTKWRRCGRKRRRNR